MPEQSSFVEQRFVKPNTIEAREYQTELAKRIGEGRNSLVVAPTALGKTVIAVLVAAQALGKNENAKILFLAPTKPLCMQHQKTMQKLMDIPEDGIILLTGSVASKKRAAQWQAAKIITATPQTIENDLLNGKISMKGVSLVIFDEAHRAVGDYSYVYIARKYIRQNPQAFILALTASPGGREEHIKEVCSNLGIKNIEIKSLHDPDVEPYSHAINIEWRVVQLPEKFLEIKALLEQFMKKQMDLLGKFGMMRAKSPVSFGKKRLLQMQIEVSARIRRSGAAQPALFAAASAIAALLKASHAHTLIETQGASPLHDYFERSREKMGGAKVSKALRQMMASEEIRHAIAITKELHEQGVKHPKQILLEEMLKEQFELFPESRVIVFNHYRDSIKRLAEDLGKVPGVRVERFVGQATKGKDAGMNQREQAEKIAMLRSGEINTIVASSVAEEGLDIPSVDLVVFYEPVPSEIRFIQRRGRTGRLRAGKAIILMAKGTRDEAFYWSSVSKEKKMHSTLRRMQRKASAERDAEEKAGNAKDGCGDVAGGKSAEKGKDGENEEAAGNKIEGEENSSDDGPEAEGDDEEQLEEKESGKPAARGEKQTTLFSFGSGLKKNDKIIVYTDNREQDSPTVLALRELGCEIILRQLGVGDYIPGNGIAIERKTVQDFLSSIVDGRLSQQLISMAESYERPLVLLEGSLDELFSSRNIHRNAIVGMLTSIALNYRVPVLFTSSPRESAQFIYVIAKREQMGKGVEVRLRLGSKGMTLPEQQRFVVESLPLVGTQTARKLLQHFGSVQAIMKAKSRELQEVDNLGRKKAKLIKKVLRSRYEEK